MVHRVLLSANVYIYKLAFRSSREFLCLWRLHPITNHSGQCASQYTMYIIKCQENKGVMETAWVELD